MRVCAETEYIKDWAHPMHELYTYTKYKKKKRVDFAIRDHREITAEKTGMKGPKKKPRDILSNIK